MVSPGFLIGVGEQAADHDGVGALAAMAFVMSPENLMPPSAIKGTCQTRVAARAHCEYGGDLGHARAGDDSRGTDRSRADANFDAIDAEAR